jgi:hypothetical protein
MNKEDRLLAALEISPVIHLLAETDITLQEIADRTQCPLSSVCTINDKYSVRDFRNRRALWMAVSKIAVASAEPET